MVAPNRAAGCRGKGFVPNRSRGDRFWHNLPQAPAGTREGECLTFAAAPLAPESNSAPLRESRYGMGPKGTIPLGMTASTNSPVALPPGTAVRKRRRIRSPGAIARTFICLTRVVGVAPSVER